LQDFVPPGNGISTRMVSGVTDMPVLQSRPWVPASTESYIQRLAGDIHSSEPESLEMEIARLVQENRAIHEDRCINLNPATNVMNPKAEALLASGLGTRASLGYPGDKYEMGLEAVERIEVIATELAAEIFGARYAEIRVPSGSMANLYAFMATCKPGDHIIVPSAEIGGHVTHHHSGAAGLYGLAIHSAPSDPDGYSVDIDRLRDLAIATRPRLITIGGSLNLFPHPVRDIRAIADEVRAWVLFDAAHLSGLIAGKAWPQPLAEGAHLVTMSTYKSLGGPPSGLVVTDDPTLAERLEKIAYPGLTANFDVSKSAALAMTLLDWRVHGPAYARAMCGCASALAVALEQRGLPVFRTSRGHTASHQFAVQAQELGGGQSAARRLRRANVLTSGIGLPGPEVPGDLNGLRIGTPEITRWGVSTEDMRELAELLSRALSDNESPESIAPEVTSFRRRFATLRYIR
jgi:glycine hydroxymethyltransferase